jgi:hypothetical protein
VSVIGLAEPTPALINFLNADVALGALIDAVWEDPAPQDPVGAETIKVVVNLQTAPSEHTGGGGSHLECWYAVQVVGPSSQIGAIRQAAQRLDALLHNGPLVLVGYRVMGAFRESLLRRTEPETGTGVRWEWLGGLYRIFVAATS